jgi:hypothetical protein
MEIVDWCCIPETELLSDEARMHLDTAISDSGEFANSFLAARH